MTTSDWEVIKDALQYKMMSSNSESLDSQIAIMLGEIEGILEAARPTGNCIVCKKPFNDLDMKTRKGRLVHICVACFTSNA
jgi:hypothetical protein